MLVELGATVVLVVELGATVVLVELGATVVLVVVLVESPSASRRITRSSSNTTTSRSALRRRTSAPSSSATKPFVTPSYTSLIALPNRASFESFVCKSVFAENKTM